MSVMDIPSLRTSIQDALDDLVSTRSSPGRKTRALAALEHLLALVCVPKDTEYDLDGFLRLQDTFECNVPSRLLSWISMSTSKLEGLAGRGSLDHDRDTEMSVLSSQLSQSLSIIQGVALNHESSKRFLGRKYSLEVMLDLLLTCRHLSSPTPLTTTTTNTPSSTRSKTPADATWIPLSSVVLDTFLCILVDSSSALRVFEECNGVQVVVKILKTAGTPREVRMKCLEFLYFYLMEESVSTSSNGNFPHPTSSPTKSSTSVSLTKRAATPPSPTKTANTAPSTPTHTRSTKIPSSLLKSRSKSKQFTPGPRPLGSSRSSSLNFSNTWGSISPFSSDVSSSTGTTTPEPEDPLNTDEAETFQPVPKTPSKSTLSNQNEATPASTSRVPLCPPLVLRKDVDIDYVPTSPKKPKFARIDTLGPSSGMVPKVRELRELSTGSRSMPSLPNSNMTSPTKSLSGTRYHGHGHRHDTELEEFGKHRVLGYSRVRTVEEKKEILGGMLGNVDALVEGVRKAGIWGLG